MTLEVRCRRCRRNSGFSLVELLVSLTICSIIAAVIGAMVPTARAAFEQTPAALELEQRGRTAIEAIGQAVRSTGVIDMVPPLVLSVPDPSRERFTHLLAIAKILYAAESTLAADQQGSSGDLVLSALSCPAVPDVCGFTPGASVVIADGAGRFDLFTVAATNSGLHSMSSSVPFAQPYPAGSVVVEIDSHTFRLDSQPDGSKTLVRETVAGAIQPIVDHVADLSFKVSGGELDVKVVLQATPSAARWRVGDRLFRSVVFLRNWP